MNSPDPVPLTTPLSEDDVAALRAGDRLLLSGPAYAARDTAHKRLVQLLERGEPLPIELDGQAIYYAGPSPARPGQVIGSAGPTTSGRMDPYTPALLAAGVRATIGKGKRSPQTVQAMKDYGAVYLACVGGAAALISQSIVACDVVAFAELGPEAIRRLQFKDLPVFVVNDTTGRDLYEEGAAAYRRD